MTLDDIGVLLKFHNTPDQNWDDANTLLDERIGHVAKRIKDLQALEKHLKSLRCQCDHGRTAKNCGILKELAAELALPNKVTAK